MEHESYLVLLLKANGASEEDCKDVDNKLKERVYRPGRYIGSFSYTDLLFLGLLEKPRIIPSELYDKIRSFRLKRLTTPSIHGKDREILTKKGRMSLDFTYLNMKSANQAQFFDEVSYLGSKMHSLF